VTMGPLQGAAASQVAQLLALVDQASQPQIGESAAGSILRRLSHGLRPDQLLLKARHVFVELALEKGIVETAMRLMGSKVINLAGAAITFLADFTFLSDHSTSAVLAVFDRIAHRFQHVFTVESQEQSVLLESAMVLCVNVAAGCRCSHARLVPLMQPVCQWIIRHPRVSGTLRANTILLLANLSMTASHEVRKLRVADDVLDLLDNNDIPREQLSVAESVVIFLHGESKCAEVDKLMDHDVVGSYCVPILQHALSRTQFRGMYPYLSYSARLFEMLSRSRTYAEAMVKNENVVPLLIQTTRVLRNEGLESDDEGRAVSLQALSTLARFRLWPPPSGLDSDSQDFKCVVLPPLLDDDNKRIRESAANLFARLNIRQIINQLLVGKCLESSGKWKSCIWRREVLSFLYPFLMECS